MSRITDSLLRLFERHRIVVWYDDEGLAGELENLDLPNVQAILVENNEFTVKHRVLREEPKSKFLLYLNRSRPSDLDNWLLDIELAHGRFQADQVALWLTELGLGSEFADIVRPHEAFFKSQKRIEALAEVIDSKDTPGAIRLKMLAICAESEHRLDHVLERLLSDVQNERDAKFTLIQKAGLDAFLWEQLAKIYGYRSEHPGLKDFSVSLFKSGYAFELQEGGELTNEATLFLRRWKDSAKYGENYEAFAERYQDLLGIESNLAGRSVKDLLVADTFELIDRRILSQLSQQVTQHTIAAVEMTRIVHARRQTHWFDRYENAYVALQSASEFFDQIGTLALGMTSLQHGIDQYTSSWFNVDQLYRRFLYHIANAGHATLFSQLRVEVDNRYTNQFLLPLGEAWQAHVDADDSWDGAGNLGLAAVMRSKTQSFLSKGNKVIVVISDAMRYEIGEELSRRILSEDRYETDLDVALAPLPSFTQLGMASLLPHQELTLNPDASVLLDGASSQGIAARQKALEKADIGTTTALMVKDFLDMDGPSCRDLTKTNDVIYLYHNLIDATGDKRDSEERVFDAAETALDELVRAVKKLFSSNASNVVLTADHGFIYQDQQLEDTGFMLDKPDGDVTFNNRRFVLGHGLSASSGFKKYNAKQLGLAGEVDVLIPRTIHRMRVKGAGSRFVHGGASMQEVLVPVLHVTKKRTSDVSKVGVDIIAGSSSIITTGQLAVTLYQTQARTEKRKARTLRAGIFAKDGTLLSDQQEITFDHESEHERDREFKRSFLLTNRANTLNGEQVEFRLEERFEDTSHWRTYQSRSYTLRRSFTSDFDFD